MELLPNKETKSKGLLLWIIIIGISAYIILALIIQYVFSDEVHSLSRYFVSGFPYRKLLTIKTIMRLLILVSFVGIIYNIKESIFGIWIAYIILTLISIISIFGIKKEINTSLKIISVVFNLSTLLIPAVITFLINPIKSSFKRILPSPK